MDGACGHIKAFGLSPIPHSPDRREACWGQHALDMLGRTLELYTDFFNVEKLIRVWGRV